MKGLSGFLGLGRRAVRRQRARIRLNADMPIYAVGDVHGCLDELLALEERIVADAAQLPGQKLIIMLGDYVDRGPASAQVIDHLMAPAPAGFERICLTGNHEIVMLQYLDGGIQLADWFSMGAGATLRSYGIDHERLALMYQSADLVDDVVRKTIPSSHVAFLRSLPILVETPGHLFVHAGIRPGIDLAKQQDGDLVFIRSEFYDRAHLLNQFVVHGHTPVEQPRLEGLRLNIDSGAYYSGRLTAVRIWQNAGRFLTN